ncbi:FadR/GntR family transcriptional regulator [Arthrobacter sp. NPDC058127]|uniref:FadR/GntR family transcriptional regulator n=1 Tax=Arthrobacter sp. NPDC058127 TaxID=3346351 RepID=UPI0036EF5635
MVGKSSHTTEADMFGPVSVSRISEVIVDQLKLLIRSGQLSLGDRLPSERDLCQRYGVSRATVREALRVLEANGLVVIKVGVHGGTFITSPSTERLGEGLADLLYLATATAADVTEARKIIELGILPLAVQRATEEDIAELQVMLDHAEEALVDGTYSMELSSAFHVRIAGCTHNPSIEMLVHSFQGPMLMSLAQARHVAPYMGPRGVKEHRALVDAIAARDIDAAEAVMSEHLGRTAERTSAAPG